MISKVWSGTLRVFWRTTFASALICGLSLEGAIIETINTFSENEHGTPRKLIQAANGDFYGTAGEADGDSIASDVFRLYKDSEGVYHKQWFAISCALPGGIMQASNGAVYVTRVCGTVEKIQDGVVSIFADLSSLADRPSSALLEASDGNFYGTTDWRIYKLTPSGVLSTLHVFDGTNGAYTSGGLIQANDGCIYGTTFGADWANLDEAGTIYKITTNGVFTSLYEFDGTVGVHPNSIIQGSDGNFYGTTWWEPERVFKMTADGSSVTQVHVISMNDQYQRLIEATNGQFYGISAGSIFKFTESGDFTWGHHFEGANAYETFQLPTLVRGNDGYFYGTLPDRTFEVSSGGDVLNRSTVFRLREDLPEGFPSLLVHPFSQTNGVGSTLELSSYAVGAQPISYQWFKDGTNLVEGSTFVGTTNRLLTITNAAAGDSGYYTVVASNSVGVVTSLVAVVCISDPFINHIQTFHAHTYGGQATMSVSVSGTGTIFYQWSKSGSNLIDGGRISGANSATLVISNLGTNDAGFYTVTITNAAGSVQGTTQLRVIEPTITAHPQSITVTEGMSASFSGAAIGSSAIGYQWHKVAAPALVDGGRISGARTTTLTISNVTASDAGWYFLIATNNGGSVSSADALLTVTTAPVITSQPTPQSVAWGTSASFSVTAAGSGPLSYRWRKDGVPLANGGAVSGASTATLSLTGVTTDNAGSYSVVVSNAASTVTSSAATLTVNVTTSILSQPASTTNVTGTTATFSVAATSDAPLFYRWIKGTFNPDSSYTGTALSNGSKYSGAQTSTLSIHNVAPGDAGTYFVLIGTSSSNMFLAPTWPGTARSDLAELSVLIAPTITAQPTSQPIFLGTNTTLSVSATGTTPITYQWRKDGSPLPGATEASFTISNAQFADSGTYDVVVTGPQASVTSDPAEVTVLNRTATYNGLFHELDEIHHETAGFITVKTFGTNFSGKIMLEGLASGFTGKLAPDATGSKTIIRTNFARENLTLNFAIDPLNEQITGTISNSQFSAVLTADYYPYSTSNHATLWMSTNTLALPGFTDGSEGPIGSSCASVTVNSLGKVRLTGGLADGQNFVSAVTISAGGTFPVYTPAYPVGVTNYLGRIRKEYRGSVLGWLTITNNAPNGTLSWIKTGWTSALYSGGFTNEQAVIGSRYDYVAGTRVMAMTNGLLAFSGGNLAEPFSASVLLKTNNALSATLPQTNKAVVSLAAKTGLYTGSFRHPENTNIVTKLRGVILQQQNYGAGFFAGTNHNGATLIVPQ